MKKTIALALCASLLLGSLAGCGILPKEEELPTAPVLVQGAAQEYALTRVNRGDVVVYEVVRARFMPSAYESLSFPIGGERIFGIYVTLGDRVQPGDLLMEVNTDSIQASLRNCQNEIDQIELTIKQLNESKVDDIYVAYLEDQQARRAGISNWVSRQTLVEEQYENQLSQAQSALEISYLRLEELQKELGKRQIIASIEGNVSQLYDFKDGERVEQDHPVIRITNMDEAIFEITSTNESILKPGELYEIECSQVFYTVRAVSGRDLSFDAAREDHIYLQLLEPTEAVTQGTTGVVRVPVAKSENTLFVNIRAVQSVQGKPVVYVVNAEGFREIRYVETGLKTDTVIEITEGVEEGEDVIVP